MRPASRPLGKRFKPPDFQSGDRRFEPDMDDAGNISSVTTVIVDMPLTGDAKREYQLVWMNRRREAWLVEQGPCTQCGSWNKLEVDHVNPEEKVLNPAKLWSLSPNNPVRIAELAKCQVLCEACHEAKTITYLRTACEEHRHKKKKCNCVAGWTRGKSLDS